MNDVALLRDDLASARYTVDRLRTLWGELADAALVRADRVPALRMTDGVADPAAVLARAFVLGVPVPLVALSAALPTLRVAGAIRLGLVEADDDDARPLLDLRPYATVDSGGVASWWVASDLGVIATGGALRTDHVLGIGGASATLSALVMPDRVGSVLDLGTGSGVQALHASRFAERVVATDISARALRFAALTAGVNGIDVDLRLGSLFEPVAGERFDRIISNPPFVITPRAPGVPEYEYRDGGAIGDGLIAQVVAGIPDHLVPDGVAQLLGNWEYGVGLNGVGGDGLARAAGWAEAAGLEWWIIERDRLDPAHYAETWIRDGGTMPGSPEYEPLLAAWLDDFDDRGVTSIGFGYLLLRLPRANTTSGASPLRRTESLPETLGENPAGLGEHLTQALAGHDAIAALDDDALLDLSPRVAPDVTEERSHWPGEEHPSVIVLRQGGGFGRQLRVGTALAAVVGACDGELSLRAITGAVAELLDADPGELQAEIAAEARELIVTGFLRVS